MAKRTNVATWMETSQRWKINVQKDGIRKSFYSSTPGRAGQREANAKADEWLESDVIEQERTISSFWDEYLKSVKTRAGTSQYDQTFKFGQNYILPRIGNKRFKKLTIGDLQDILDLSYKNGILRKDGKRRSDKPLSRKTLQGIRAAEVSFIKWARMHNYTDLRPEEDLSVPAGARTQERNILQPDAVKTLFTVNTRMYRDKRRQDEFIFAYRFLVSTGLRPGELCGLRCGDIKGNVLTLNRAINRYGETTDGKNQNALRTFVLNEYAAQAYWNQLRWLRANDYTANDDDPLFPMHNQQSMYTAWKAYQKSNGIEPPISLYECRHTFVSMVQDISDAQLKQLVGHSKSMDTRGTYDHKRTFDADQTACDLTTIFGAVLEG